jgi:hypothetical protein
MNILDEHISILGLDVRSTNALLHADPEHFQVNGKWQWTYKPIDTVRKLVSKKDFELLRVANLGRKSLKHIKERLQVYGLTLDGEIKPNLFAKDMDLRDYFAAKAMQSMLNWEDVGSFNVSQEAYMMADAMMEARK